MKLTGTMKRYHRDLARQWREVKNAIDEVKSDQGDPDLASISSLDVLYGTIFLLGEDVLAFKRQVDRALMRQILGM